VGQRVIVLPGPPLRGLARSDGPAPGFGQHTAAILEELAAL